MPPAKPLTAVEAVFVTTSATFAAPKLNHALGSLSAMKHASAHVTAASDSAVDPFNTSNEFDRRAARMTSDFASSRAASWFGSNVSYSASISGAFADRARANNAAKYTAFIRLSAANPAATRSPGMFNAPATAT